MSYFYDKYLKADGDPAKRAEFCYAGRKPQSREEVIIMICDALEASSRTLKDYSDKSVSDLVEYIVKVKNSEDQFSEADITMRDLETIKEAAKKYIGQLYHGRIAYPKRKKL